LYSIAMADAATVHSTEGGAPCARPHSPCRFPLTGRLVRTVAQGTYAAGHRTALWDGRDEAGRAVAGGVYVARLLTGGASAALRVPVLR
jgi:hypothetical protein